MKSKHLRILLAVAVTCTISALAQTGSAATPSAPAAAPATPAASGATAAPVIAGTKVGAINMEAAIFGCNEGRREVEAVQKKFEPKQAELKGQNDELEALKKQLATTVDKLNDDAAASLKKQIETKQKSFDRAVQDAQEDYANQNQEIFSRLLPKVAPVLIKYSQDNGFGMIIDTSKQWPQGPVLMAGQAFDITQPVIDNYNTQSGVAAPTAKPAAPKPATGTGAAKPAAPKPAAPAKQ